MTLTQFNKKLQKDYDQLVAEGSGDYKWFLKHAYRYAHYNEIQDFFEQMNEEDWNNDWKELIEACDFQEWDNVIEMIYNNWLNYNHPEYYNFFCYEGLIDILRHFFKIHKKEAR